MTSHKITHLFFLGVLLFAGTARAQQGLRFDVAVGGGSWIGLGLGKIYHQGGFNMEFRVGSYVHPRVRIGFRQSFGLSRLPFTAHKVKAGCWFPIGDGCYDTRYSLGGDLSKLTLMLSSAFALDVALHDRVRLGLFAGVLIGGKQEVDEFFLPRPAGGLNLDVTVLKGDTFEWVFRAQLEVGLLDYSSRAVLLVPTANFVMRF